MESKDPWNETTKYEVLEDLPRIYGRIEELEEMGKVKKFFHGLFYGPKSRKRELKRLREELEIKKKHLPDATVQVP
jgi:hypothetical protein